MIHITIVGAGSYGSRISEKYKKFPEVNLKALVSRHKPKSGPLSEIPFVTNALEWRKKFKAPKNTDVFDMCVHQNILISLLNDFIKIGAKNFILPKPIALSDKELIFIQKLVIRYGLNIVIASQWHYSGLLAHAQDFIKANRKKISRVDVAFSRSFDEARRKVYSPLTAFVPHAVQILHDLKLIKKESRGAIEHISRDKIKIKYQGKKINIESDINSKQKDETLKIYIDGNKKPSVLLDFSGVMGPNGFVIFPKITINKKEIEVKEDLLEKMIEKHIHYFQKSNTQSKNLSDILTFNKYMPVAEQVVSIAEKSKQVVGVIGGGIFGIMTALQIAEKGYSVIIFEKNDSIINGASLVNHGRIHMGYHYPRDTKTVVHSMQAKEPFEKFFGNSVVRKIDNYYMVANEGSMTSQKDFLAFCRKMNLPHTISWPASVPINKDKIGVSVKVPERIFDAHKKRDVLLKKIMLSDNITLLTGAEVKDLKKKDDGYDVTYRVGGEEETTRLGAVVNATYGGTNYINDFLDLPLQTFQYELCEIPVTKTPWGNSGWMIMDGPFFSAMPFGFSDKHLFYDVELSVLDRVIGKFPDFKFGIEYYDTPEKRKERFAKYIEKWGPWLADIKKSKHVSSMYVVRVVLHQEEKTDKRPTIVNELLPGFWQIFSGKVATSVTQSKELGIRVDAFLKKKRK